MSLSVTKAFTPGDWYWIARNGSIYASGRNVLVPAWDAAYVAFVRLQGGTTPWPNDANGQQTSASMAQNMLLYGIVVTPPSP